MLTGIYEWMKNILIFMLGITVLLNLIGKGSYQKYAKFIAGMVLVIYVARPVLSVFGKDTSFFYFLHSYGYLLDAKDNATLVLSAEEMKNSAVLTEFKKLLASQTDQLLMSKGLTLLSLELTIEESLESEQYGSIRQMDVVAGYQKEEKSPEKVPDVLIEQIVITIGDEEKELAEEERTQGNSVLEISAKNMLADFYNLEASHINIIIREDNNG